nr:MAG: hypothetical protein [Lokiarchaeota virus Ratatoskr Meg22_1012]
MMTNEGKVEKLARKLHEWYLEAIEQIDPSSFNHEANKPYDLLTDDQKFIDNYIAENLFNTRDFITKQGKVCHDCIHKKMCYYNRKLYESGLFHLFPNKNAELIATLCEAFEKEDVK